MNLDDRGIEELSASVIGQAYKDYIRGRLAWYTFDHRNDSAAAAERYEKCIRKKLRGLHALRAHYEKRFQSTKWTRMTEEELREQAIEIVEHDAKVGRATARSCRRFITGSRYELFASKIDAEALLQHAEELLADWLDGKISERDLYPSGYGV